MTVRVLLSQDTISFDRKVRAVGDLAGAIQARNRGDPGVQQRDGDALAGQRSPGRVLLPHSVRAPMALSTVNSDPGSCLG